MKDRDEKNIIRGDFIDKLREIAKNPQETIDRKIITAQGIIFFAAGFETTSHTLSTLTYNLAVNPKIQEKVQLFDIHFIKFQEQFCFCLLAFNELKHVTIWYTLLLISGAGGWSF